MAYFFGIQPAVGAYLCAFKLPTVKMAPPMHACLTARLICVQRVSRPGVERGTAQGAVGIGSAEWGHGVLCAGLLNQRHLQGMMSGCQKLIWFQRPIPTIQHACGACPCLPPLYCPEPEPGVGYHMCLNYFTLRTSRSFSCDISSSRKCSKYRAFPLCGRTCVIAIACSFAGGRRQGQKRVN